jgi:hypothetical protein
MQRRQIRLIKQDTLPSTLLKDTFYLTKGVDGLLVCHLTNETGAVVYHTPLAEGLTPRYTRNGEFIGSGVYTLTNQPGCDVLYLPPANGSLRFIVVNVVGIENEASTATARVVRTATADSLNGIPHDLTTDKDGMWLLSDAATGEWTSTRLSGKGDDGLTGDKGADGCAGPIGRQGPKGIAGGVGERGQVGPIGPPGNSQQTTTQLVDAVNFTITHGLGWYPVVVLYELVGGEHIRKPENSYTLKSTPTEFTIVSPTPVTGFCVYS